jgi:hypothetical protein
MGRGRKPFRLTSSRKPPYCNAAKKAECGKGEKKIGHSKTDIMFQQHEARVVRVNLT